MFQDTRPDHLDAPAAAERWAGLRVDHPQQQLRLLRDLREGAVPIILSGPDGSSCTTSLWAIDEEQRRLAFDVDAGSPPLARLIEQDEAVAVAYLESVKLQFDLQGLVLVRGQQTSTLQSGLPGEIYRFQRRSAYRVRPSGRHQPLARLRHPSIPEMQLALRVLDLSIGGCALWLPQDVPPLQEGTRLGEVVIELEFDLRFTAAATLQHVRSGEADRQDRGVRMGCEWQPLTGSAERVLQRWIDQAQKRRRLLSS